MDIALFVTFLGACAAAAATGVIFQPGDWYDSLRKPSWTPPRWVFPVAWTTLYLLMALAATRIAPLAGNGQAMAFWALQIALNTLWTPVFFGARRIMMGMVVILCLWAAVALTLWSFWTLDLWAGLMFVPYLLWVTIASALNLSVLVLNRQGSAA